MWGSHQRKAGRDLGLPCPFASEKPNPDARHLFAFRTVSYSWKEHFLSLSTKEPLSLFLCTWPWLCLTSVVMSQRIKNTGESTWAGGGLVCGPRRTAELLFLQPRNRRSSYFLPFAVLKIKLLNGFSPKAFISKPQAARGVHGNLNGLHPNGWRFSSASLRLI